MQERFKKLMEHAQSIDAGVFDDPRVLMTFVQGAEFGDIRWISPFGKVTETLTVRFRSRYGLNAGTMCSLYCSTRAQGVSLLLEQLTAHVDSHLSTFEDMPASEWEFRFVEKLPAFVDRAPMYFGSWLARDAFVFFEGYCAARQLAGLPYEVERESMARAELVLQLDTELPGRWDRILDSLYGDGRERFTQLFECYRRANDLPTA
jgi:hypothetical protein